MRDIFRRFPTEGEALSFEELGDGHINRTYLVDTDRGVRYVLQRINRQVFPDPGAVMDNLAAVGAYLDAHGEGAIMIRHLAARGGGLLVGDEQGEVWRLCRYVENSVCRQRPASAEELTESGRAFGAFLHALRDFPAGRLKETIPDFHNTPLRYEQLRTAAEADVCGRKAGCAAELAFALRREKDAGCLQRLRESGALPLRVTHNDTKFSNCLLDADSGKALCVIDLDTVMPGLAACDYGDAIRAGASRAEEDEETAGTGRLDLDLVRAFTRGFLTGCPSLTEAELASLPLGAWTMTLECGVRFLTDWLMGDVYFATSREGQNLARCRAQFALLREMEERRPELERIVAEEAAGKPDEK